MYRYSKRKYMRVIEGYQEASGYQNINAFFAHNHEQYTKKFHD